MAGKKGYDSINIYAGTDYGFDSDYGKEFSVGAGGYRINPGTFGYPSDPTTANQLKAVSDKFSTGAKTVEVSGVNIMGGGGPGGLVEKIPRQHFKEINRLKKLVGVDLTFHGPIIEPSGWGQGGWSETDRAGSERQMWSAVERSHDLEPKGNIVVTFHSSAGLPELKEKTKTGEVEELIVYDERNNGAQRVKPKVDYLVEGGKKTNVFGEVDKMNKETWSKELSQLAFHARQGAEPIEAQIRQFSDKEKDFGGKALLDLYAKSKTGEWQKIINSFEEPSLKRQVQNAVDTIHYGETYLKEAYLELQNNFNKAWEAADRNKSGADLERLKTYRSELKKVLEKTDFDNPQNLLKFGDTIQQGVNTLNSLSSSPKAFRPMNEFINDKSAETFSNIAFNAYKKFGDTAPIISVENPPAGGAISRGEDLKELIKTAREKFVEKAKKEIGLSESDAKRQADKLIGVTWDVGHINMLRKQGFGDKEIVKETEKVAKMIKHIHLSDNFGYEHTELPMGMGNVPTKGHLEAIEKYNKEFAKIKQIVETGDWFSKQGGLALGFTPVRETLRAFDSPIYPMEMGPYWGGVANTYGGGSSGYGRILPEQHFSMYGAGFSNMPVELGGQMQGRSRVSGNPIE